LSLRTGDRDFCDPEEQERDALRGADGMRFVGFLLIIKAFRSTMRFSTREAGTAAGGGILDLLS
jgi:hypothetical protein